MRPSRKCLIIQKKMSQVQSGRSWVEVDGPDESKDKSERPKNVKVDCPKVLSRRGKFKLSF